MIGLVDCNNFYASCERVFRPDLRNTPCVVLSNNDGCVIARSNEAKSLGIKMGAPFFQIKGLLEENGVAVFSSNYTLYGDMSRRVMTILSGYTPKLDIYSIDEAFMDFSGIPTTDLLPYVSEMVRFVTKGTGIPISLGIASTKTLAKMASKFAKRYKGFHSICIIDTDEKREKALKLFDIADVWGIGRRIAVRLKSVGVETAWDFVQKSESWVRKELDILEEAVANFAAQCARKLKENRTVCKAMTVFAYTSRFRNDLPSDYIHRDVFFQVPTNDIREIVSAAVKALRGCWKGNQVYLYKKAGVIVWDTCSDGAVQGNLFDTIDRGKQMSLAKAIDEINRKNGFNTIRVAVQGYGMQWKLKNEYVSKRYTTNLDEIIDVHLE